MTFVAVFAAAALASAGQQPAPVKLSRTFAMGEKAEIEVKSSILSQERFAGMETYMPSDLDLNYKFSYEVTAIKADGICEMRYKRPSMTEIEGETFESLPKAKVEKLNWDMVLTVSPINEIIALKDLTKKPEKKPGGGLRAIRSFGLQDRDAIGGMIGSFLSEIFRLGAFVGSLDSSLDFSPKLPLDEVVPGDTWKRTVGYSPQKLQGKEKLAVQRLDYTYTYRGLVASGNQKVHRITADIQLTTDLASFIHQTFQLKPEDSGLKEIPLTFKGTLTFDLDPKTGRTLRADGVSEGEFKVIATFLPNQAALEEKFKGTTKMRILTK